MVTDLEIKQKIIDFLRFHENGSSASDIAKGISHNRITVGKYLQVLEAENKVASRKIASALFWKLVSSTSKPKVLIVDDEKVIVDLIRLSLTPGKYVVAEAYDGEEALQKAFLLVPDVIVLDIMMPKLDGVEVCKQIKKNSLTSSTLIVVVSAKGQIEDKLALMQIGADEYITKPFDPFELEARISSLLCRKQLTGAKHPVTNMPVSSITDETRLSWSKQYKKWYELRVVVNNFDDHVAMLGHRKSNDILKLFLRFFLERVQALVPTHFVGHVSDTEFAVFSTVDVLELEDAIKKHFQNFLSFAYADLKIEKGNIFLSGKRIPVLSLVCKREKHVKQ